MRTYKITELDDKMTFETEKESQHVREWTTINGVFCEIKNGVIVQTRVKVSIPTENINDHWIHVKGIGDGLYTYSDGKCETYIGKWLIFTSQKNINDLWNKIKCATEEGFLGISSKVSTKRHIEEYEKGGYVICVYTKDFRDKYDVNKVLQGLRKIGITHVLYYKPDNMTFAGIYANDGPLTKKKGRANLYCSTDFDNKDFEKADM